MYIPIEEEEKKLVIFFCLSILYSHKYRQSFAITRLGNWKKNETYTCYQKRKLRACALILMRPIIIRAW